MPDHDFNLGQQVAELRGLVIKGFEGIHQRQDITNGRIAKAESRIEKIEVKQSYSDGRDRGKAAIFALLGFILASVVIPIISAYIQKQ